MVVFTEKSLHLRLIIQQSKIVPKSGNKKWWRSPRSLLIDTNHSCGRRPLGPEISAPLRLCVRFFTYHLKGDFALPMVAPRSLQLNF